MVEYNTLRLVDGLAVRSPRTAAAQFCLEIWPLSNPFLDIRQSCWCPRQSELSV